MIPKNVLASLKKSYLAPATKYASHGRRMLVLPLIGLALTACQPATDQSSTGDNAVATTLSGSVGDGPITQAQITVSDNASAVISTATSDVTASYSVNVPAGSAYPVLITATGGTDVVTGATPDFTLVSVALNSSAKTVNINPFSTLIVKTAQAMSGGLTAANLSTAKQNVLDQLNFGLNPALVPDPITTAVNETNVAAIIKASEAFGEVIRRTRSTLQVSGLNYTGDDIIDFIAGDMTDGVMDGRGPGANVQVAATANILAGQVLVEALGNQLNVNGADATSLMDVAINLSLPSATMTTADVVITEGMLNQARIAVAAAQTRSPSSNLSAVAVILAGLSGNSLAADVATVLPVDPGSSFNEVVTQMPLSTDSQLESVNTTVRSGAFQFADSTYSVGEGDGSVNITINRIGGHAGEVTVQWRTLTFNGNGTADFANDYGSFNWTVRTLTFADGETSKVEQIAINQDTVVEGDETFSVLLRDSIGNVTSTAVVTIVDDDNAVPEPAPEPEPVPSDRPWENLLNSKDLVGYGSKTTGGKGGEPCLVNNLNNSGAGSLRQCAESVAPKWILFNVSGTINLSTVLDIESNKTIDGRGQDITISGQGVGIRGQSNVIVHNITIINAEVDGIAVRFGSRNVWIDHVTISGAGDEKLDISAESTDVTVSWSKFLGGGYGILVNRKGDPATGDSGTRVTLHHNHFAKNSERTPRIVYAQMHMFNNYIDKWSRSACHLNTGADLLSENNIWERSTTSVRDEAILSRADNLHPVPSDSVISRGEWAVNNVIFQARVSENVYLPTYSYTNILEAADSSLMARITDERFGSGRIDIPDPR